MCCAKPYPMLAKYVIAPMMEHSIFFLYFLPDEIFWGNFFLPMFHFLDGCGKQKTFCMCRNRLVMRRIVLHELFRHVGATKERCRVEELDMNIKDIANRFMTRRNSSLAAALCWAAGPSCGMGHGGGRWLTAHGL